MDYYMAKQKLSLKVLHLLIVFIIIIAIVFTGFLIVLKYSEKGETNMPFYISKISIISTIDGQDVENSGYKWSLNVIQNNDVYIYIEKNDNYKKQETIKSVLLTNFNIVDVPKIGTLNIYKPTITEESLYVNTDENIVKELEYIGTKSTDKRKLEISNQGGVLSFRLGNNNVGTYLSNDDEEINYETLAKKINISKNDIKSKITFDMIITLNSGKAFKAESIVIEVPNKEIVEKGTVGTENTDLDEIVFKRTEN